MRKSAFLSFPWERQNCPEIDPVHLFVWDFVSKCQANSSIIFTKSAFPVCPTSSSDMVRAVLLLSSILILSCQPKKEEENTTPAAIGPGSITSISLNPSDSRGDPALFSEIPPSASGLEFTHRLDLNHPLKRLYHGGFATGGIAIGDLDGDQLPEIFLASGPAQNRLYKNLGGLKFEAIANTLFAEDVWSTGAAMADIDNDGDLDLYLCCYQSPNRLFINQGNFRFTEEAARFGLDFSDASLMPSFCDYDNDGDLDCFILTYRLYREGGWPNEPRFEMIGGSPAIKAKYDKYYRILQSGESKGKPEYSVAYAGRHDRLFRNDGNGSFSDVSEEAGIVARGHGLSATWWDANDDGFMDLYVGNDFNESDRFYLNQGDGTFKDVVRKSVPHTTWFSMGADFADLNNDGLFDFLIADMSSRTHFDQKVNMGAMGNSRWFLENASPRQYMRNALYLNSGTTRFEEAAYLSGLADTDWTWAVKLADFDNDGLNDAYFTNGAARQFTDSDRTIGSLRGRTQWDAFENGAKREEQNLAFRTEGQLRFSDVSKEWGLDHTGVTYSAAYGDLDNDGDLDLVCANLDEPVSLYRNNIPRRGVTIQLQGSKSNRFGYGSKVKVITNDGVQIRQLAPASGFLSSNQPILHFGTGGKTIDTLEVSWPGGHTQEFTELEPGKRYLIEEGCHEFSPPTRPTPVFSEKSSGAGKFVHRELPYDDYAVQPLLANKLSQLGPGLASSQGLIWYGGAKGQAGEIWSDGELLVRLSDDAGCEDMGGVFLDIDSDGDDDLYVVSGGVESASGDASYRDRLYFNQAPGGHFEKAPLPDLRDSGGPVAAADFDRDGDLDLFVGGRFVPGAYPSTPNSRLLVNEGGKLSDQSDSLLPDFANQAWSPRQSGRITIRTVGSTFLSPASGDRFVSGKTSMANSPNNRKPWELPNCLGGGIRSLRSISMAMVTSTTSLAMSVSTQSIMPRPTSIMASLMTAVGSELSKPRSKPPSSTPFAGRAALQRPFPSLVRNSKPTASLPPPRSRTFFPASRFRKPNDLRQTRWPVDGSETMAEKKWSSFLFPTPPRKSRPSLERWWETSMATPFLISFLLKTHFHPSRKRETWTEVSRLSSLVCWRLRFSCKNVAARF